MTPSPSVIAGLVLAASLLAGCVVTADVPFGEEAAVLDSEQWNGTWVNGEALVFVRVVDENEGLLRVSGLEFRNGEADMETADVLIRSAGSSLFASIPSDVSSESERVLYLWAMLQNSGNQITVWHPDIAKIRDLVIKGVLPGEADGDDVVLGNLEPRHYEMFTSETAGVLFDWMNPVILIRMSN